MKIAVLSDSHDHIWKLDKALPFLRETDAILHCGDLCSPFVIRRLGDGIGPVPLHIVWGNNDGDRFTIGQVAEGHPGITLHGQMAELDLGGLRVAVNHYPEIALGLAFSGRYEMVCYGHDHLAHEEWIASCLLLNPGEIMGMKGRSSFAIVDSVTRAVRWIEL